MCVNSEGSGKSTRDPESFVRGGPTLTSFLVNEGRDDLNTIPLYKRVIIGPPTKRHLNGVSLACQ